MPYVPLGRASGGRVLKQNTGRQAALLRMLATCHKHYQGSLPALMRDRRRWASLLAAVGRTIEVMPLWRLQLIGRQNLLFLYERGASAHEIVLKDGVAYCLRRFHPLIQDLVQGAWVRFVRSIPENGVLLGAATELSDFLFGSERASLAAFHPILRELQGGRCFYCHRPAGRAAEVDHFIPWSRYAMDLGHNFVLADAECNARKKDRLPSEAHLESWCERNADHGAELALRFDEKGLLHDLGASLHVTRWAYAQAEAAGAQVWRKKDELVGLNPQWRSLLGLESV